MCAPCCFLRRAGSRDYIRTDDGKTFDVAAPRERASEFCLHLALDVRAFVEKMTGARFRLVLAGYRGHTLQAQPASASIDALAVAHLH